MNALGLVLVVISGAFFGSQFVPKKLSFHIDDTCYNLSMCLGIFINALLWLGAVMLFSKDFLTFSYLALLVSFISGFIWSMGNILLVYAVTKVGMARSFAIVNFTTVVSFLGGVLFIGELKQSGSLISALIAMFVIIFGCIVITKTVSGREELHGSSKYFKLHNIDFNAKSLLKNFRLWSLLAPFLASFGFGSFNVLIVYSINILALHPNLAAISLALGALTGSAIIVFTRNALSMYKKSFGKIHVFPVASGIIWGMGNVTLLYGLKMLGLAVGIPVSMGVVTAVSALWGIAVFKEISAPEKKKILLFVLGLVIIMMGVWLINQT